MALCWLCCWVGLSWVFDDVGLLFRLAIHEPPCLSVLLLTGNVWYVVGFVIGDMLFVGDFAIIVAGQRTGSVLS